MRRLAFVLILLAACATPTTRTATPRTALVSTDPQHGPVVDYGGPVWPTTTVHVLWWGWNPTDPATVTLAGKVSSSLADLIGSSYLTTVAEYMRGAALAVTFDPTMYFDTAHLPPGTAPTSAAVGGEVKNYFGGAMLAQQPATYIVLGNNRSSYAGACAWHDVYHWNQDGAQRSTTIVYLPNHGIVDDHCYPYGNSSVLLNEYTWFTSHEVAETITDPFPCNAYGAPGSACTARSDIAWAKADDNTWENADICIYSVPTRYLDFPDGNHVLVQGEWSNAADACVFSGS